MASPGRNSDHHWDGDGVLISGTRWKPVSQVRIQRYGFEFDALTARGDDGTGRAARLVTGSDAAPLLASYGASREALRHIWNLADTNATGSLRFDEFVIACYLSERQAQGQQPPVSLEGFPLGRFPPRAEGAAEPLVKPPKTPPKPRVTQVKPFHLTEPGSFSEFSKKRESEESGRDARKSVGDEKEKKFADQTHLDSLHQRARVSAVTLAKERQKAEAEGLAEEEEQCTFVPETLETNGDRLFETSRRPLRDRASGIVLARDTKRWLARELAQRGLHEVSKTEARANFLAVDLEVDPAEFANTTAARWEKERLAKEKALESARVDLHKLEARGPAKFTAPHVPGLELEKWNLGVDREGPWHTRLSKTSPTKSSQTKQTKLSVASDQKTSPAPTIRSSDALHTARALHVEAQLREKRREAEIMEADTSARNTSDRTKLSARSGESHARRVKSRLVAVMRLARVLLAGDTEGAGGTTSNSNASLTNLPREAVSRVLRATKILPSTLPEHKAAQRDEARKVWRLCSALRAGDTESVAGDNAGTSVSAVLVARCIGAATQAQLERLGVPLDEKELRYVKSSETIGADDANVVDSDANVFGDAFDAGRVAHSRKLGWWPHEFNQERVDAVQDAFLSITGPGAASTTLARTPICARREDKEMNDNQHPTRTTPTKGNVTPEKPATPLRKPHSTDIAERLAQRKAVADANVEAARERRDALEAAECTFAPSIGRAPRSSKRIGLTPGKSSGRVFSPGVAIRAMQARFEEEEEDGEEDTKRYDGRHEGEGAYAFSSVTGERLFPRTTPRTSREAIEAKELLECTFAPKINRFPGYLKTNPSAAGRGSAVVTGNSAASVTDTSSGTLNGKASEITRNENADNTTFRRSESMVSGVRKPWEPRGNRDSSNGRAPARRAVVSLTGSTMRDVTKQQPVSFAGAPPGFANSVARMRGANAAAAALREESKSAVERRTSWVDPRELRDSLRGVTTLPTASPKFHEKERAKKANSLAKFKESRKMSSVKRLGSAKEVGSGQTPVTSMASLTPVKMGTPTRRSTSPTARSTSPTIRKTPSGFESAVGTTPNANEYSGTWQSEYTQSTGQYFSFHGEKNAVPTVPGLPPVPSPEPPDSRNHGPRVLRVPNSNSPRSSSETTPISSDRPVLRARSPQSPVPLDEAPDWVRGPKVELSVSGGRSRMSKQSGRVRENLFGFAGSSLTASATLAMHKNAPSLTFASRENPFPGFRGSPGSIPSGCGSPLSAHTQSPSLDGYPYTKFVLGEPVVRLELTIGQSANGKTKTLTFHEHETTKNAARRFCEEHRLPKSTIADVVTVLTGALRAHDISHRANSVTPGGSGSGGTCGDTSFSSKESPRYGQNPTLADLAA
jgi:hypothetical protein